MSDAPTKREGPPDQSVEPIRDVLRALREEVPSDDSRRATLAALGLAEPALRGAAPDDSESRFDAFSSVQSIRRAGTNHPRRPALAVWVLVGLALGVVLALLLRAASG